MVKTKIIGILNITPDSFSDGGDYYNDSNKAVERVRQMLKEGADYIDIGGESTRPGSIEISAKDELSRVLPVINAIKTKIGSNVPLSIDSWKQEVVEESLKSGCTLVNSLGGFNFDTKLADVVAKYKCNIIIYHIKGQPKTMQKGEIQYSDVIKDIYTFFENQIQIGQDHGIQKQNFILDPGIGFGKTVEQNIEIIKRLKEFKKFELPIAIGVSRKSHLGSILQQSLFLETSPLERLEASLAETAIAVMNGATMIRTHDILETRKFLAVVDKFKE